MASLKPINARSQPPKQGRRIVLTPSSLYLMLVEDMQRASVGPDCHGEDRNTDALRLQWWSAISPKLCCQGRSTVVINEPVSLLASYLPTKTAIWLLDPDLLECSGLLRCLEEVVHTKFRLCLELQSRDNTGFLAVDSIRRWKHPGSPLISRLVGCCHGLSLCLTTGWTYTHLVRLHASMMPS